VILELWKARYELLTLSVVAFLGIAAAVIHHKGYAACQNDIAVKTATAAQKNHANVVKVERSYAPTIQRLQDAPDSGPPVGPLTTGAIDSLRR